jgi:hypothetical protein
MPQHKFCGSVSTAAGGRTVPHMLLLLLLGSDLQLYVHNANASSHSTHLECL